MDWTVYTVLQLIVSASVLVAGAVALFKRDLCLFKTSLIFAISEFVFYVIYEHGQMYFDHAERQYLIIAANIICCVAVMLPPAKVVQCWFGAAYLVSGVVFGLYVTFYPNSYQAYYVAWDMATAMTALQAFMLLMWTGVRSGFAHYTIIDPFCRLVHYPRKRNLQ